jgi:hypothetical protein
VVSLAAGSRSGSFKEGSLSRTGHKWLQISPMRLTVPMSQRNSARGNEGAVSIDKQGDIECRHAFDSDKLGTAEFWRLSQGLNGELVWGRELALDGHVHTLCGKSSLRYWMLPLLRRILGGTASQILRTSFLNKGIAA